ncbi:MAG: hypothetical protein LBT93_05250, partial [Treponema sp.]|jgi:hypothetical protein|nr:hypothetical protein [Treponema sp.]
MKHKLIAGVFLLTAGMVFSQRLATVAVFPLESGDGISPAEAERVTGQVLTELRSWGLVTVVEGDRAENAEYLIRGSLSKTETTLVLNAASFEARTGRTLNTAKEQGATLNELGENIFSFCVQAVENIPFPNYLLGKWLSVIDLGDGPLTCILEFRSDRTVVAERYDTYEYRNGSSLTYQGYGGGTYSFAAQVRRNVALKDSQGLVYQEAPVDGVVSLNLSLEDSLPQYASLSRNRINLTFDEAKSKFELISGSFLCGENLGGPEIYPQRAVAYTHFTKIQ